MKRISFWLLGILIWGSFVGGGFFGLYRFETTPGQRGETSPRWPVNCPFQPDSERFTLVMAIHPKCPCSRASLRELAEIMAQFPDRAVTHVLLYEPQEKTTSWQEEGLERSFQESPEIYVIRDPDALIARDFGCATSGHVLLYAANGHLVFSGGITRGRGQEGASLGSEVIRERLRGRTPALTSADVFGCPLMVSGTPGDRSSSP